MKYLLQTLSGGLIALAALWLLPAVAHAQNATHLPLIPNTTDAPFCRFGVNGAIGSYAIEPLRLGWYLDYQAVSKARASIDYYPVIRLEPTVTGYAFSIYGDRRETSAAQLNDVVADNLGTYWLIGNEPDRLIYQDGLAPDLYATAYHDLYIQIKAQDPTAKIVAGTIVQPTPLRLEYLDLVLESYFEQYQERMPVDVWAFHNFILNEASCSVFSADECWGAEIPPGVNAVEGLRVDVQDNDDIELFKEQVIRFRQWLADRGYRNVPVFLSEYGILMPEGRFSPDFDSARVNRFMDASFDFLLNATDPEIGYPGDGNRLVQRFSWYSVEDKANHNGYLFDNDLPLATSRTEMGDNLAEYTAALDEAVDFSPVALTMLNPPPLTSQRSTTITLQATIANSGNLAAEKPVTVRFYRGDPATSGVQIGEDQVVELAGCGERATVQQAWGNVTPGDYQVYVQVISFADEDDRANNVTSVEVSFSNERLWLPGIKSSLQLP